MILSRTKDFRTCYWMAKEIGVVAIPPSEFYSPENRGLAENYARFAFCKTDETLDAAAEALKKLRNYIV
jgi:kynurenine aminotransferase